MRCTRRDALRLVAAAPFAAVACADDLANGAQDPAPEYLRPGADPQAIRFRGKVYWCRSTKKGVDLYYADTIRDQGTRLTIWQAPAKGPYSREIWAPEIHFLDGKFYVYFAADDGDNANHKTYVLVSETDDPTSRYELTGPVYTGDDFEGKTNNRWAIDATVLEKDGKRYLIWSGWEDTRDVQYLYGALLSSPPTDTASARVKLCANDDYVWERVEERIGTRGLNEGPSAFYAPNGKIFLTYACAASWLPTYKVGLLELVGEDPLAPGAWRKRSTPFLDNDERQFGVGHGAFFYDEKGELLYLYHAKRNREPGWARDVFCRPVVLEEDGAPRIVGTRGASRSSQKSE